MVDMELVRDRVYVRHEITAMEEDLTVEFKGHRSITMEDDNPRHYNPNNLRSHGKTRQSWSKYIVGFLNSGMGGTLYAGILDNGSVAGIALTYYQMQHVRQAVEYCLTSYKPPCSPDRLKLRFVPLVERQGDPVPPEDPLKPQPRFLSLDHSVRQYGYCWCDCEAGASFGRGFLVPFYVIELEVLASISREERVFFRAEDGCVYIRKHGNTELYTDTEVAEVRRLLASDS